MCMTPLASCLYRRQRGRVKVPKSAALRPCLPGLPGLRLSVGMRTLHPQPHPHPCTHTFVLNSTNAKPLPILVALSRTTRTASSSPRSDGGASSPVNSWIRSSSCSPWHRGGARFSRQAGRQAGRQCVQAQPAGRQASSRLGLFSGMCEEGRARAGQGSLHAAGRDGGRVGVQQAAMLQSGTEQGRPAAGGIQECVAR